MDKPRNISSWHHHLSLGDDFDVSRLVEHQSLTHCWASVLETAPTQYLFCNLGGRWVTRGEFDLMTRKIALLMHGSGLGMGDRIVMSGSSSVGLIAHYVAALRLGLVVVPMNTAYTEPEVKYIITDVKPSGAIVDSKELETWIKKCLKRPEFVSGFNGPGGELPLPREEFVFFDPRVDLDRYPVADVELDQADLSSVALIAYTSGTTGRPKGAILSHGSLLASARSLNYAWRWSADDRLILSLPLFHMHGLGIGVNGTLCAGSSAVIMNRFDPLGVNEAISTTSASMFFGVPTMYQRFVDAASFEGLRKLRLMVSGSAPLSVEVHKAIREGTGETVLERYGTTESLINISNPYFGVRKPGTVGFPLPGVEVALDEITREVLIKGPTVFTGYLSNAQATSDAFVHGDGWFSTGDVGEVDQEGYISIVGRLKDLIITGGYNVYPKEVEEVLRSHPSVRDAAVVGIPSPQWGEEVVAFVISEPGVTAPELIAYCGGGLANYKRPKRVIFVEEFPRNALGKVLAFELRKLAQGQPHN